MARRKNNIKANAAAPVSDYLNQLKATGIIEGAARLRLARRLSDLIYAMLKNNRPYDVEYFHQHRRRKSA